MWASGLLSSRRVSSVRNEILCVPRGPRVRVVLGGGCRPPVSAFPSERLPTGALVGKAPQDPLSRLLSPSFWKVLKHTLLLLCSATVSEFETPPGDF